MANRTYRKSSFRPPEPEPPSQVTITPAKAKKSLGIAEYVFKNKKNLYL